MANIFRESLTLIQGTGVIITPNNAPIRGQKSPSETISISIGQNVSVTSNVVFSNITATNQQFQINQYYIKPNQLTGSIGLLGSLTLDDTLTVGTDMNVLGTVTAQKIESQLTQSVTLFESGSTIFGNSLDDTHQFSGSFSISGSIALSENVTIGEISNDTSLTDNSTVAIATENAVKSYIDNVGYENFQIYLRKCFTHTGSFINSATSSFTAITASAPSGITSTTENDFMFFINGQIVEHDGISIQQNSTSFLLKMDSNSIGYDISADDELIAWGKFNS
jgi:hypothetical protein